MAPSQKPEFATNITDRLNSIARRIRQLEENVQGLRNHLKSLENEFLKQRNERLDFKTDFNKKEEQIKIALTNLEVEVKNINRRLRKLVSKRELQEIESFIEIFNPLKSTFVTKNEVKKMIEEYLQRDI